MWAYRAKYPDPATSVLHPLAEMLVSDDGTKEADLLKQGKGPWKASIRLAGLEDQGVRGS